MEVAEESLKLEAFPTGGKVNSVASEKILILALDP